jgi:phosphoglycerate dehydrogenase-like enzyme
MTEPRHAVWFERPVLSSALAEIQSAAVILGPRTPDDRYRDLAEAHAVIAGASVFDADFIDHAPNLRVIARTGIGVDGVDLVTANERGIAVCNAPDGPTISTAEHTMALLLAVAKNLSNSAAELRKGGTNLYAGHRGVELHGKTLGLVGFGRIARRVADMAAGFAMNVVAFDPHLELTDFGGAQRAETLPELVSVADVVSVHVPLVPENAAMFDADLFAAMKSGAIFINTARGGLVDHGALLGAIDTGILGGAGLDVTDPEPLEPDHPLLHRANVVVTPHVATATDDGKLRLLLTAFRQAIQVLDGERPPHLVNPEVWNREESTA